MTVFLFPEPECYKIDSKPKGLCLLINNMTFKEENLNRHDAIYDEERLHNLFAGKLDFEVHAVNDLDNCQMQAICTEFGGKDHRQYDAFVCIIMSHGTCGDKIKGVNGRTIGTVFQQCKVNGVFLRLNKLCVKLINHYKYHKKSWVKINNFTQV